MRCIWTAVETACLAALLISSATATRAASLDAAATPKRTVGSTANVCDGDCGPPRTYYRAYRPYTSQYYWRPHYYNTIVSDQPFHAQPVPWWATDYSQHYYIGPAFGY